LAVGVRNRPQIEFGYVREIIRIAGVERQPPADRGGRNHGVRCACGWFASSTSQTRRDSSEHARSRSVERQRFEIGLGHLQVRQAGGSLVSVTGDQWSDREFPQSHRADDRLVGSHDGSVIRPSRITVDVSSRPHSPSVTTRGSAPIEVSPESGWIDVREVAPPLAEALIESPLSDASPALKRPKVATRFFAAGDSFDDSACWRRWRR